MKKLLILCLPVLLSVGGAQANRRAHGRQASPTFDHGSNFCECVTNCRVARDQQMQQMKSQEGRASKKDSGYHWGHRGSGLRCFSQCDRVHPLTKDATTMVAPLSRALTTGSELARSSAGADYSSTAVNE